MTKTIFKVFPDKNWVAIHNGFAENKALSWKAKGLMVYLVSRPEDWTVQIADLVNRSTDGSSAVYSAINELIEAGYIHREQERDDKGRISQVVYYVYQVPEINPHRESPDQENLDVENLNQENRTHTKKHDTKTHHTKTDSPAQNAGSSSSKTEETSFMRIDLVDDQDVEHPCARCEEMINVSSLEKSNAKCPYCGYGVWVYDWNGKSLKKPPQGARKPKRKGKTLRDFFPEINESLARYVLSAYQEKRLRALIKIGHQSLFLSSLEWAQQKIKETHMPPDRWIDNALTAAEGKSENQTVTEDAIKRDVTAYVEPSASVKLHVLNLSREYELPEIEMAIWWASTLTEYYDENNMNWDSMSETQKKYGVQRIIDNKWHGYWNISEYVEGWKRNG